ncbi:DUF4116 domain-containing protein [Chitinophaga arvensicola]|uniref:DUF4116 domain-containing protein n=1 Tax=Chitinophaga arvensicola TaxID=29529 RepID=A0A1I0SBM4_9BACT|nr:DUF4116 domain-containing protein [Chitinophaga arvensicola]SEW54067.1 hypothetical protein SAMN04488122_5897 [Chitinophaga arvensicola]
MNHLFRLISTEEAIIQYQIDEQLYESKEVFEDIVEGDSYFYLHEGDLLLNGHFILDTDQLTDTKDGKRIEGYIVTGDLTVTGNIINEEGDYGPALYVTGDVSCQSMLLGGSPVHITGNVTAAEVIMVHYNHGWMKCPGVFTAPVYIGDDYHFIPAQKHISLFYMNDRDPASPPENAWESDEDDDYLLPPVLQQVLNNPLTITPDELRRDLAAGEAVLQPQERNAEYWRRKVAHNWGDLRRAPMEFRTREICLQALQVTPAVLAWFPPALQQPDIYMQALDKFPAALQYFPASLVNEEVAAIAVHKHGKALRYLPEQLITRELCYTGAANGATLQHDIPEHFYEPALLLMVISHNDYEMQYVPAAMISEDLLVAYVKVGRGAYLDKYCNEGGVSKARVLERVVEDGPAYLENLFGWHLSPAVYNAAQQQYDNDTYQREWQAITQRYATKIDRVRKQL